MDWVEDESNQDIGLGRNFLRHQILPLLRERWPAAATCAARSARHCAETLNLLDCLAENDLEGLQYGQILSLERLCCLPEDRARNVLRYWLRKSGLPVPGERVLARVCREMGAARSDACPHIQWAGGELRAWRGRLYAGHPLPPQDSTQRWEWDLATPLELPGLGRLWVESKVGAGIGAEALVGAQIEIGLRLGGERLHPVGVTQSRTLKNLLRETALPPWRRQRLPLIWLNGQLAAVADLWVDARFAAAPNSAGRLVRWEPV